MDKYNSKANSDLTKKIEDQIAKDEKTIKQSPEAEQIEKLQEENKMLKDELEWMVSIYNGAIENMYDKLDDFAHLVKKSRLDRMLAQKPQMMQQLKQAKMK